MNPTRFSFAPAALLIALCAALPAHALYKVIGPDGKVSYTDRPPLGVENKVQPVNARRGGSGVEAPLPYELRQVAQRYPVTMYSSKDCSPCNAGRQLLANRGIPFIEKSVTTPEDAEALQRLVGSRDVPALTIGSQTVLGLQRDDWASYLDAAGYPKESKLPPGFQQSAATPLAEPKPKPAPTAARARPAPAPAAEPPAPSASGFRF